MTKYTRRQAQKKQNQWSDTVARKLRLSQAPLQIILLVVIVFGTLSYLFYMNQTATGGFDIKGIEQEISQLEKQHDQLNLQVAELQSLSAIESASAELELVATSHVEYLPAVGSAVAQR